MNNEQYITWLQQHAMLEGAKTIQANYSGKGSQWQRPYAQNRPGAAATKASVWFTAYPVAIMTADQTSVLQTLADPDLWQTFQQIGISGIHTGPLKRAGGIDGTTFTPTIDGHFDRISLDIDPQFGTASEYKAMIATAETHNVVVIGDCVPLHSGKGADWRLAERAVGDYPGLYHMVEIDPQDWSLLPDVPNDRDSINLKPEQVDTQAERGYIIGRLSRVIFYEPGVKESNWSITPPVTGADGTSRRWVYLHYFKEGQPVFNWLDQTFAAQRLVMGDILHSLKDLGEGMVRLDANGFLGIEKQANGQVISEGHALAVISNQLIASFIRKVGGFSFQELNLTLEDMVNLGHGGADLSYDFVTRPAYHHALVSGDTEFLRLMLRLMHSYKIKPNALIHGLQNHDELTLELVHFWTAHATDRFKFQGAEMSGLELRETIRQTMFEKCMGPAAPYNLQSTTNGIACTTVSLVTAALGIDDLTQLTAEQIEQIKQSHLLLVVYNAFQPGVFALSGWDLVGALPLPPAAVAQLMADGDTRWINRGSYDLLGKGGAGELPEAQALYGPLPRQLQDPTSFASQLKQLLAIREQYRIYESRQIAIIGHDGLLVMVHKLPETDQIQITALNFGSEPLKQKITLPFAVSGELQNLLTNERLATVEDNGEIALDLPERSFLLGLIT